MIASLLAGDVDLEAWALHPSAGSSPYGHNNRARVVYDLEVDLAGPGNQVRRGTRVFHLEWRVEVNLQSHHLRPDLNWQHIVGQG